MADYLNSSSLEGKVVLTTGAFYGIGFAIVEVMADAGTTIVFNDIKQELVDKELAAHKEEGIETCGYVCDMTSKDTVSEVVGKTEKGVGVVNILVNNTDIIKRIPMCNMTTAKLRQVIDVGLNASFIVSKVVIPSTVKKGHGKIINICSIMSESGCEAVSAYTAAKDGLKMLIRNITSKYGECNVQCSGIGPGHIATSQTALLRKVQPGGSRYPSSQFIVSKTPTRRWGEVEDLGGSVVFLTSDTSNFANGLVPYMDGGILVHIDKQPK